MSMVKKVRAVERVFDKLDKEIRSFQNSTSLHCLSGCGACCKKPDIEATILEFLPFAYHLFKEGQAMETYEKLRNDPSSICMAFSPFQVGSDAGFCGEYPYRGLICRLFGFSAVRNKYGEAQLLTCRKIKEDQAEAYEESKERIRMGMAVPFTQEHYLRLYAIDPDLSRKFYPINIAITKALEEVLKYYSYRRRAV